MRALRHFRREVSHFLEDPAHGILLLDIALEQAGYIYMVLSELDARSADVQIAFPHAFESAAEYVDIVAGCIVASAREARGEPDLELPPTCCGAAERSPSERLIALLTYARDLLPAGSDSPRLVCALAPLTIAAKREDEYLDLVRAVVEAELGFPPWFHRMRLVLRAPMNASRSWRARDLVRSLTVDLSTEALEASAAADADDPELPERERAISLLQDATMLLGRTSYAASSARFRELLTRAQRADDPVLLAMALIGLGDVELRRGRPDGALDWYERGLTPAAKTGAPVILLNVTSKLAHLYQDKKLYEEAETFFDGAQQLAGVLPEPQTQTVSLEWRGRIQELRGAKEAAALSFLEAAKVARDNELTDLDRLLGRLRAAACEGLSPEQAAERDELLGSGAHA